MSQCELLLVVFVLYVIFNEYRVARVKDATAKKSGDIARKVVEDFNRIKKVPKTESK